MGRGRGFRGRSFRGRGRGGRQTGKRSGRKTYGENPTSDPTPTVNNTRDVEVSSEGEEQEDDIAEEEEDGDSEEASSKPKAYNLLLQSLKIEEGMERKPKRRKLRHEHSESKQIESVITEGGEAKDEVENGDLGNETDENDEADDEDRIEGARDGEDNEFEDMEDPFESHFCSPSEKFLRGVESVKKGEWETTKMVQPEGNVGKMVIMMPGGADPSHSQFLGKKHSGKLPDLKLKPRLQIERCALKDPLQQALTPAVFSYTDLCFASRTLENLSCLRHLYSLHAINHILKTRDRVLKNNTRLSRLAAAAEEAGNSTKYQDLEFRDQGFTRPKVLIILPTRNACMEVVDTIVELCRPEQQENRKRFNEQFGFHADAERLSDSKPEDFKALFRGNHDDLFRIGVKFTRKSIKFFSTFYNSDIIIASPLGLRMAIGGDDEVYEEEHDDGKKGRKKRARAKKSKKDYDFLSSIEVTIVDQADALLMQNWEHLEFCFQHINLMPTEAHDTDFSRVRNWCLDDLGKYLRQTIILSTYITPEINSLFNHHMLNIAGRVRTQPVSFDGELTKLQQLGNIIQTFYRFDCSQLAADPDSRFKFFTKTLLPMQILKSKRGGAGINNVRGVLIFIPSYFDFIRVRNHLASPNFPTTVSFGAISEETPIAEVARARSHFLSGQYRILLYSGRAHHFRRFVIKGVKEVVFYQVPDNPVFYEEIGAFVCIQGGRKDEAEEGKRNVRLLFSKYDAMRLERVVGTKRVGVMVAGKGDVFEFL